MSTAVEPISSPLRSLRSVTSKHAGTVNYINANEAHDADELLAEIGYKQELNRSFNAIQVFGIAFSIMGLLPSIATVLSTGLTGGPASLVWSWFVGGFFILLIGIGMAEMASSIPTSGGLYYWTYYYAPPSLKAILSFVIGTSNSLALAGGLCSITYGLSEQILAAASLGADGSFEITNARIYGVYAACIIAELSVTCFASSAVSKLQTLSIVANCGLIVLFFIALPVGTSRNASFNDGDFIFGKFQNFSDWTDGWAFFLSMMSITWTVGAFDSCLHMSEEAKNPTKSVPFGIVSSISVCWILGFFIMIVINACITKDLESVIGTELGQPLAQVFYDSLGKKWAIAFISLTAVCQFLMGASVLTAISRQAWAFARDDGLPFSSIIKVVNKKLKVPVRAVAFSAIIALLLGLLILAGSTAANALFSIAVIGNYLSWATPQVLRFTSGRDLFRPGYFYTGKILSPIITFISVLFQIFIMILACFPSEKHLDGADSMNYAVVINCGIWILSLVYFYVYKRKIYIGPKSNLSEEEYIEATGQDMIDDVILQEKNSSSN